MKSEGSTFPGSVVLFTALIISLGLAAQDNSASRNKTQHHHYKLIDLGTLGGPHSYGSVNGDGFSLLNNSGVVASFADLNMPDPNQGYFCYDPDCYQAHAFQWKDGVMTDLGALPVNNNSAVGSINARGLMTGQSQSEEIDPVLGIPEFRAVLWRNGQMIDLGTMQEGKESLGAYVNDSGEVIGIATISTAPDPFSFLGGPIHTFIWRNGTKVDIGTLGGADTVPGANCGIQPGGIVVGSSTTSTDVNPETNLPTAAPFLWRHGKMINLGTLGGAYGIAQCANNRGQVIGHSSTASLPGACSQELGVPGCHAFLWQNGVMTDLGTLGGDAAEAVWLNDAGDIVGSADFAGGHLHDAVLWRHGIMYDLGTVPGDPCSRGRGLNAHGQVVGGSSDCHNYLHAFLWENSGPMVDLNTLIQSGTGYQLTAAFNINDRGEILAKAAPLGFTPNDDADLGHLVLLIPCDDEHPDIEGCDYSAVDASTAAAFHSTPSRMGSPANDDRPAYGGFANRILRQFGRPGPSYRARAAASPAPEPSSTAPVTMQEAGKTTVTLVPSQLGFGCKLNGVEGLRCVCPTETTVLTNTGNTALDITAITTSRGFGETHTCGATLAPKKSCSITVTTGGLFSWKFGELLVNDSAAGSPQSVSLHAVCTF